MFGTVKWIVSLVLLYRPETEHSIHLINIVKDFLLVINHFDIIFSMVLC